MRAAAKAAPGISIHPPRAGRDCPSGDICGVQKHFQSTRPVRGGTPSVAIITTERTISIHPPRAGRDVLVGVRAVRLLVISIHPPRAGRDKAINLICGDCMISIHPPRAGRDAGLSITLRGRSHFNPPAPCGAGQQSCTKFIPCILAQYTIQRAAKLLSAYQQAYFC